MKILVSYFKSEDICKVFIVEIPHPISKLILLSSIKYMGSHFTINWTLPTRVKTLLSIHYKKNNLGRQVHKLLGVI